MKIAFITSCLEPGRDGVGDYTALLAAECERRGHDARLIALNDPHVEDAITSAGLLRLSSAMPWRERVEKAADLLSLFAPDFVSLQFVCYGFHPRGIDFKLPSGLRRIIGTSPVHIMFHELWIGAEDGAPLKDRLTGCLQRRLVLRTIRSLDVRSIHTSNIPYMDMLRARGIEVSLLPLFGTIPINLSPPVPGDDALVFGMFGALPPVWPPEPLFSLLLGLGRKIVVVHAGDIRGGGVLWERMENKYEAAIEFKRLGCLPPERIAQLLSSEINFGIATAPWELIGKSASVAAMLEQGVPVIVNRDDWHLHGRATSGEEAHSPLLIKMDETLPQKIQAARRESPESRLSEVTGKFLADMERAL